MMFELPMMRVWMLSVLLVSCLLAGHPAQATSLDEFFKPAPDKAAAYDPQQIYPQGRIFPFSYFSSDDAASIDLLQRDLTPMTGPRYGNLESVLAMLDRAGQAGLKAIHTLRPYLPDGTPVTLSNLGEVDMDQAVASVAQQVRDIVQSDRNDVVAWWYIQPEELRFWRKHEITFLQRAADIIRQTDPQKRPVWMYDPGHRSARGLAPTAEHLDIVGKGMYTNYSSQRESRIWCRWTIEVQNQAIAEVNPSAISIAVPEMFREPDPEHVHLIPAWVRHDVYLSLVSGARGVVIFSLGRRPNFPSRMDYYQAYAQISRELMGELDLGQVFLFGQRRDDLTVQVTSGPQTVDLLFSSGNVREPLTYPSVSHLDVAHGSQRYLFLINSANEPVQVEVSGLPRQAIDADQPWLDQTMTVQGGRFAIPLEPLEVRMIQFHRPAP